MMHPNQSRGQFAIVVPVYNHGATVARVVARAASLRWPVYVVDDGSTDGAAAAIGKQDGVTILRHRRNKGKGAALMTGLTAAAEVADWAVCLDADGQHDPGDIQALIRAIPSGIKPLVIGCRLAMRPAGAPWTSRFGRRFSNFWVRVAGGPSIEDSQSGFRIYPLPETLHLGVKSGGYQFEIEVLVKAAWQGMSVIEAPIHAAYGATMERISHFHPFLDFLRNGRTFSRLIFQRITGLGKAPVRRQQAEKRKK